MTSGKSGLEHDALPADPAKRTAAEPQLATQWARIRSRLQSEVGDVEYRTWLKQMSLVGLDGDEVTVTLPTRFLRDWVRGHYGDRLNQLWSAENGAVRRVDIRIGSGGATGLTETVASADRPAPVGGAPVAVHGTRIQAAARPDDPRPDVAAALDGRFTFETFVVGKPNEFAYACARRVAEHPASPGFNPLFLFGGVGLGKTHLMHAIAWELVGRSAGPAPSVAYMSAEKFMYRFIAAIRSQ